MPRAHRNAEVGYALCMASMRCLLVYDGEQRVELSQAIRESPLTKQFAFDSCAGINAKTFFHAARSVAPSF